MNVWCQENGGNDDVILSSYQMIWKMFCVIKMGILLCVFFFDEGKYLRHLKCQWFSARAWHSRMCFPPKIVVTTFFILHIFIEYMKRLLWKKNTSKNVKPNNGNEDPLQMHQLFSLFSCIILIGFYVEKW